MQRVALIQLNVGPDPAANLPQTLTYLEEAARGGADFILTPECSNFLCAEGRDTGALAVTQHEDALLKAARGLAEEHGVWVCLGSLILRKQDTEKLANRQILISPQGEIAATYDKIHLFDVSLDQGEG